MVKKILLSLLFVANLFTVGSLSADEKTKSFIKGEWSLNLNRTLDDADYDQGHYIFKMKDFHITFDSDFKEAGISGIPTILKDDDYNMKVKSNKQVVIDVTPASKKLMSLISQEPLFNYQQKKIILKKYKDYLIATYRPSKESGDLKLYFSKKGQKYKERKDFKIDYNKLYVNIDDTIDENLRYMMFFDSKEVSFSDKPFTAKDKLKRLSFENGSSKKVFIDEGEYLVVMASKMFRLYKKDEKGKKHYYKPSK